MGSKRRLLSTATHDFAERGLRGEFGQSLVSLGVSVGDVVDVEGMSEDMLCAHSIRYIGDHAPVRVIPGELLAGSATLKESPQHMVPVYDRFSVSHTTLGFDKALRIGLKGIRRQVEDRLSRGDLSEPGADLLNAMLICLDAAASWHRRYVELLGSLIAQSDGATQAHYLRILGNLKNVPENPPSSFAEAIQSLWLLFTFVRLCGNWPGLGRIDQMLGPFLAADLANGKITLDEAREYIAHFWIKGTEWIGGSPFIGSGGDAQHYQNIILGGIDEDGQEVTNDVTYLVLDVIEELRISDYPVAVRINSRTPEKLLRRIAEVQQCGGGIVSVYNEDVVIESLVQFGYPLSEARNYTNDGCWEAIIPGKTCFGYMPFDMLLLLQSALGLNDDEAAIPSYDSFESLYAAFRERLSAHLDQFNLTTDKYSLGGRSAPLVSIFVDDCIERGRGYDNRGPVYSVLAPHAGGLADTANSLLAIKRLVYEQKRVSLEELVGILRADWNGHEELRREVVSRLEGYGNDDDVADEMVRRLFDDFTELASRVREREGVLRPAGISTFGREIEWRSHRKATADGHRVGEILATNFSPSPGTDRHGPTAALTSYCKMDFAKLPNMGTLEIKMLPSSIEGEEGVAAIVALLRAFVDMGGCYLNIDSVDSSVLIDAQKFPEKYPNLAVRISGWCARFNTLGKDWQDMIIHRTQQIK